MTEVNINHGVLLGTPGRAWWRSGCRIWPWKRAPLVERESLFVENYRPLRGQLRYRAT